MDYTTLGRTGLRVSVAGLGCGGFSRLGLATGRSEGEAEALVRAALDLGVNLLDTAASYGTEDVVGRATASWPRDELVIATKANIRRERELLPPGDVLASLERSLRALRTDHLDVFQLHGVPPWAYDHAVGTILPVLRREQEKGRIRHIGITETAADPGHAMLQRALADDLWDTMMVHFHLMHQNARTLVFPETREKRVGTLLMFVVRNAFSRPERLRAIVRELAADGQLPRSFADDPDPLGFLVHEGGAADLTQAAYRYARHEPGADVVLFGTGDPDHLRANIASILQPPLPEADRERIAALFGHLVGVGLDRP